MTTIHKYPLQLVNSQQVEMPIGTSILCVQMQGGVPTLWARVNSEQTGMRTLTFYIVGTGHEVPTGADDYIGTVQQGPFVWHIFRAADVG